MHKTHPLGFLSLLMKWLYYVNIMILIIFSLFQHHEAHTFSTLKHTFNLHARKTWALHAKQCYGARIHQPCLHNVEIRSQKQQCQWKRKRNYSSLPEISSGRFFLRIHSNIMHQYPDYAAKFRVKSFPSFAGGEGRVLNVHSFCDAVHRRPYPLMQTTF